MSSNTVDQMLVKQPCQVAKQIHCKNHHGRLHGERRLKKSASLSLKINSRLATQSSTWPSYLPI